MGSSNESGCVGCVVLIVILGGIGLGVKYCSDNENVMESKTETPSMKYGVDPHQYETMEALYRSAEPFREISDAERALLPKVASEDCYGKAMVPRSEACMNHIANLNAVRNTEPVQAMVQAWAKKAAAAIRSEDAKLEPSALQPADVDYKMEAYLWASEKYAKLLGEAPAHRDARNNYALSHLHLGHDLLAQMQLEALRQLDSTYVPAMVNLTVVFERTWPGNGELASPLSEEALRLAPNSGPAVFNAAWYRQRACRSSDARQLIAPLVRDDYHKADALSRTEAACK
jgi:hypothetical protein